MTGIGAQAVGSLWLRPPSPDNVSTPKHIFGPIMQVVMAMILDEERGYFEAHKAEFLAGHRGQYVLIKRSELLGIFPDAASAYADGLKRFGLQPFLVRQILEEEPLRVAPILSLTVDASRLFRWGNVPHEGII